VRQAQVALSSTAGTVDQTSSPTLGNTPTLILSLATVELAQTSTTQVGTAFTFNEQTFTGAGEHIVIYQY
jgi:hypothetical protein